MLKSELLKANVLGGGKVGLLDPVGLIQVFTGMVLIFVMYGFAGGVSAKIKNSISGVMPKQAASAGAVATGEVIMG